jgi:hypothetical protein
MKIIKVRLRNPLDQPITDKRIISEEFKIKKNKELIVPKKYL